MELDPLRFWKLEEWAIINPWHMSFCHPDCKVIITRCPGPIFVNLLDNPLDSLSGWPNAREMRLGQTCDRRRDAPPFTSASSDGGKRHHYRHQLAPSCNVHEKKATAPQESVPARRSRGVPKNKSPTSSASHRTPCTSVPSTSTVRRTARTQRVLLIAQSCIVTTKRT